MAAISYPELYEFKWGLEIELNKKIKSFVLKIAKRKQKTQNGNGII